ncbi:hypothetical protein [Shinella pollutisoli]|uniref:Uncharacterized protein n=1 Tax=Shinella pollutisoli TaxID=2250594 RepID=A0ABV7DI53_9HYPH|nr:hypothetical protein [Shinella pollutisoli]
MMANKTNKEVPVEHGTTGNRRPTERDDKHQRTVDRWEHAHLYREEVEQSKASRKPRIPTLVMKKFARSGVTFEQAMSDLRVSRSHLRAACIRTATDLQGGPRTPREHQQQYTEVNEEKEFDMSSILAITPNTTLSDLKTEAPLSTGKRRLPSDEIAKAVERAVRTIVDTEGVMPNLARLHKETGFAYKTLKKYWPGNPEAARRGRKPKQMVEAAESRAPATQPLARELVQMVSELVYGAGLVPGTYTADDGVVRCDSFDNHGEELTPLIRAWRHHEDEVAQILAIARDLSPPGSTNAAVTSA